MSSVAILTPSFFDYDGSQVFHGGSERYLMELARLLRDKGHTVAVFQAARQAWVREYRGLSVHGLPPVVVKDDTWPETNRRFQQAARGFDRHIYWTVPMASPEARPGSLAVCHGIWWDDVTVPRRRSPAWLETMLQAMTRPAQIVANDTNIINWVRTVQPALEERFSFIPNFVDTTAFTPVSEPESTHFEVLFPRRLVPQRGFAEALEAARRLTASDPTIRFRFVGRGGAAEEAAMAAAAAANPRIGWEWREPEQMAEAYRAAHVVLIPSRAAEGTSLSCLEAMACGRPVVAGWVGGLGNLVIHEYNGLLLQVSPDSLVEAVLKLKADPELRRLMGLRGRAVAEAHSLARWRERWSEVLDPWMTGP